MFLSGRLQRFQGVSSPSFPCVPLSSLSQPHFLPHGDSAQAQGQGKLGTVRHSPGWENFKVKANNSSMEKASILMKDFQTVNAANHDEQNRDRKSVV